MSIYTDAISHFGAETQWKKAGEELAELIVAIHHYLDGKIPVGALISEMADVRIVVAQMEIMLDCERKLTEAMGRKLTRLDGRIRKEKARAKGPNIDDEMF